MNIPPWLRIFYILLVSVMVFVFNNLYVVLGLLGLQLVLWVALSIPLKKLRPLKRVLNFVLLLLFFYAFFSGENDVVLFAIKRWDFGLSYDGLLAGLLMGSKVVTMLLATFIVRNTMRKKQFVQGLRSYGLSNDYAEVIDGILGSVEGKKKGRKNKGKPVITTKEILKGNLAGIPDLLNQHLAQARERFKNSDVAIIAALSMVVTLVRMMKIAPGFPIAPGHKNLLVVPLLILGSRMTSRNFGATGIGLISGVIHFALGFGKFGPLGIFQFALLGLVIDLMLAIYPQTRSVIYFALIGVLAGLTRVSAELFLAWILNMPQEYYLVYLPFVLSQCGFGAASAIVTGYLVKRIK